MKASVSIGVWNSRDPGGYIEIPFENIAYYEFNPCSRDVYEDDEGGTYTDIPVVNLTLKHATYRQKLAIINPSEIQIFVQNYQKWLGNKVIIEEPKE